MADTMHAGEAHPPHKRRRLSSTAAEMASTIQEPGSIKINVTGAYIIKRTSSSTSASQPATPGAVTPPEPYEHDKRDIRLPNHTAAISHVAADIGGSLAKIVYFSPEQQQETSEEDGSGQANKTGSKAPGGRLHFLKFETDKIDACIEFMRELQRKQRLDVAGTPAAADTKPELCVMATGGGAFKYYERMRTQLGVDVIREDEMSCLIQGLDFFINEIPREVFTYDETTDADNPMQYVDLDEQEHIYPYLLVNIGSGVSMIKVSGPSRYQRIGGTSLGGGTLWGLLSLLTGAQSFDDMLAMSERGDNATVDLLVGDIYGDGMGYEKIGLSERTIASSFGKVFKRKREAERHAEDGSGALVNGNPEGRARESSSPSQDPPTSSGGSEQNGAYKNGDGRMFKTEDISRSLLYAVRSVLTPRMPLSY